MRVARRYTSSLASPYQGTGFRKLRYLDGGKVESRLGDARHAEPVFEIPDSWPDDVCATFFRRCVARVGVPSGDRTTLPKAGEDDVPAWLWRTRMPASGREAGGSGGETSARQTIDRLAGDLTWWGWKTGYFDADSDAAAFFDELRYMLCHRLVAPDLSLWFRAGRNWAHGADWDDAPMFVADYQSARAIKADAHHAANRSGEPWSAAVFNLRGFLDGNGGFDPECLAHGVRLWTIALDISIHMTAHAKPRQAESDGSARPIGIEPANLSSLLLAMGLAYDSAAGRSVCAAIMAVISGAAHGASAELAGELGAAPTVTDHIIQCARAARDLPDCRAAATARRCWDQALADGGRHGFRNSKISVTPSRRDSCRLLDTEAVGIEPGFALAKFATSHSGGLGKHMNPQILGALSGLGYNPVQIEDITRFVLGRGTLETAPGINHHIMIMAGFNTAAIRAAEAASGVVTDIRHALGADDPRIRQFSRDQIAQATRYCCGAMTFDGAPHIKPEHLPVFDWSPNTPESGGRMGRAAHPFLDITGRGATEASWAPGASGVRRGRFMVYEGGEGKERPAGKNALS